MYMDKYIVNVYLRQDGAGGGLLSARMRFIRDDSKHQKSVSRVVCYCITFTYILFDTLILL